LRFRFQRVPESRPNGGSGRCEVCKAGDRITTGWGRDRVAVETGSQSGGSGKQTDGVQPGSERATSQASARSADPGLAETWKRVRVAPGIELHLCGDLPKSRVVGWNSCSFAGRRRCANTCAEGRGGRFAPLPPAACLTRTSVAKWRQSQGLLPARRSGRKTQRVALLVPGKGNSLQ
jgi:hypothetical protein